MPAAAKQVAVIGAGAAGLVAARELVRAGHMVQIYEQSQSVGGVWVYEESTEDDLLGEGRRVHSSLYASLRTNLPRDLMAFLDYPFDSTGGGDDDWPRFPDHTRVREYLHRFADDFELRPLIEFGAKVVAVERHEDWRLRVESKHQTTARNFDAVVVCNGHYFEPRVPHIPGAADFPAALMHSHNYRRPQPYAGQRVALLGTAASGVDLHRELARVAEHVYFCGEAFANLPAAERELGNVSRCPLIESFRPDGRLQFVDGTQSEPIDTFIFCTGYHFAFPFLGDDLITVDDDWIRPIYQHLLHIDEPTLAFIGLPIRIIPFPLFEMQSRWFARLLRGEVALPSREQMHAALEDQCRLLAGDPKESRHAHLLGPAQTEYYNLLAAQCGEQPLPDWYTRLAAAHYENVSTYPTDFRDRPLPQLAPTVVPAHSITAE